MFRRLIRLSLSLGVDLWDRLRTLNGACAGARGVVLYYHAVPKSHRANFARQMDWLCAMTQPWSLNGTPSATHGWAGISFDDAYVSILEYAVPELEKRSLPFTVFVPTGCLGGRPSWVRTPQHPFWSERVVSAAQLQDLMRVHGVTVGSHTVTHPRLTRLATWELERELRDSKAVLEDLTGRPVELLSFPHGDWSPAVVERALAAGYRRLYGIEPVCLNSGPLPVVVGRVAVEPWEGRFEFGLKIRGGYRWAARSRQTL